MSESKRTFHLFAETVNRINRAVRIAPPKRTKSREVEVRREVVPDLDRVFGLKDVQKKKGEIRWTDFYSLLLYIYFFSTCAKAVVRKDSLIRNETVVCTWVPKWAKQRVFSLIFQFFTLKNCLKLCHKKVEKYFFLLLNPTFSSRFARKLKMVGVLRNWHISSPLSTGHYRGTLV